MENRIKEQQLDHFATRTPGRTGYGLSLPEIQIDPVDTSQRQVSLQDGILLPSNGQIYSSPAIRGPITAYR
jgi:hypothetical protein